MVNLLIKNFQLRLKQKLERELLVDQETQESLFTNTQSSLFSSGTAVKLTTKRKKNGFAKGANQKVSLPGFTIKLR